MFKTVSSYKDLKSVNKYLINYYIIIKSYILLNFIVTGGVVVTEIVQLFSELYQRSSNYSAWFNELLITCRLR